MLQMSVKSGDNDEQVLDLVDVPEFVLQQFCEVILRRWDLRNPDARYALREFVNALKIKAEEKPVDQVVSDPYSLKAQIAKMEELLDKFDQE